MKIFVGISGASGSIYAARLLKALDQGGYEITLCVSNGAVEVMRYEARPAPEEAPAQALSRQQVINSFLASSGIGPDPLWLVSPDTMSNAFASGSSLGDAAIICPCSMSTVGSLAAGITRNLIHRVADVMIKESRPLLIVPRETPLSEIHLRNLLTLRQAGVQVVPAMPAFYHEPRTIEDLADFVVGKVLDVLKIRHELYNRWEG